MATSASSSFIFPRYHSFPPLYTPQPSASTEASRLSKWSSLILSYCQHSKIYTLVLVDALNSPLFHNSAINRQLALNDVVGIIESMRKEGRAEWGGEQKKGAESREAAWIYWRTPEEWAMMIYTWVRASFHDIWRAVLTYTRLITRRKKAQSSLYTSCILVMRRETRSSMVSTKSC